MPRLFFTWSFIDFLVIFPEILEFQIFSKFTFLLFIPQKIGIKAFLLASNRSLATLPSPAVKKQLGKKTLSIFPCVKSCAPRGSSKSRYLHICEVFVV